MCMALSTYQNMRHRRIRWKRRVSRFAAPCALSRCTNEVLTHSPVKQLTELLAQVKDEQGYIVIRERTHRNTAESTNARVKWWSIFQMGVLLGQGAFQIWWLRRFFEVKDPSRPSFNKGALG